MPADSRGIVLIADNLDRIVETQEEGKPSNYDEIYLNRREFDELKDGFRERRQSFGL